MHLFGITFGEGNSKVGEVFTFSLPSKITCPGASSWCRKHCNMSRFEKFRPTCGKAYKRNLSNAKDSQQFTETVIGILPRILDCLRIHVSGDFWSKEYIQSWIRICNAFPQTRFWAYTRSWNVPELLDQLKEFQKLPNVELFASTDPTMPLPSTEWRIAFVDQDKRARGLKCAQQYGKMRSCLDCGYCFRKDKGNVIFKVH
jgi:hypothetical protein